MIAFRLAEAMSYGWPMRVALRSRPPRTVQGEVTHRLIVGKKLVYRIAGEDVPLERVKDVKRWM